MKYAFLIYEAESARGEPSPEEMAQWGAFDAEVTNNGTKQAGEALHPSAMGKTVRVRDGNFQLTDGPFAETKDQLGGFYILDVPDLDAALEVAKKFPNVGVGSIEIRPVVDFSGMGM